MLQKMALYNIKTITDIIQSEFENPICITIHIGFSDKHPVAVRLDPTRSFMRVIQ